MGMIPAINSSAVVIDANFLIVLCAKEPDTFALAREQMKFYGDNGYQPYAPGVLVAEVLFALCRKLSEGSLTPTEHNQAVTSLNIYLQTIAPPPSGDTALTLRAEAIRGTYGCSRSADGLYIALAEELAHSVPTELVTFDVALAKQVQEVAPTVKVVLLAL